ncbi:MAG: ABC transporter ATP-binding protein [Rectinemataceae bacterium]
MNARMLFHAENLELRYSVGRRDGPREPAAPEFATPFLQVSQGERIAFVGPNGSGKTTLLKAMNGLLRPSSGILRFLDEDAWASAEMRRRCVYLHQQPYILSGTVSYNVGFGCRAKGMHAPETESRVREFLDLLGLSGFAHRRHRELSGGEAQRVALARAMASGAEVLLLDEPTASADAASAELVRRALRAAADSGVTLVFSTHDETLAHGLATRRIEFSGGVIASDRSL